LVTDAAINAAGLALTAGSRPCAPAETERASSEGAVAAAWAVLAQVPDPEVPALSLCDLGIVREVTVTGSNVQVVLTPTYSGCPATEVIAQSVVAALTTAGFASVSLTQRLSPPWTTDWMSPEGRRKLRDYGIAPPDGLAPVATSRTSPISIRPRNVVCPRCGSNHTERLSAFGATACKALHRCLDCREPFEHFKPI
jgi:ring-1,2-phenylacetyl-CoA epoxidase subunit PaaD